MVPCAFLALTTAMLAAVILGWVSYRRRSYLWAVLLTALPILTGIIPALGVVRLDGTN